MPQTGRRLFRDRRFGPHSPHDFNFLHQFVQVLIQNTVIVLNWWQDLRNLVSIWLFRSLFSGTLGRLCPFGTFSTQSWARFASWSQARPKAGPTLALGTIPHPKLAGLCLLRLMFWLFWRVLPHVRGYFAFRGHLCPRHAHALSLWGNYCPNMGVLVFLEPVLHQAWGCFVS